MLVEGKQRKVNRVTMPKLLPPPLRAFHRSGFVDAEAVTIDPDARTSSYSTTFEQARPNLGEKNDSPPKDLLISGRLQFMHEDKVHMQ